LGKVKHVQILFAVSFEPLLENSQKMVNLSISFPVAVSADFNANTDS